jgi:hypothetical protein
MLAVAGVVLILVAIGFGRPAGPSQANSPSDIKWSDPLTQHQEAVRGVDAWTDRLTGLAKAEGKAPAPNSPVVNERANKAYADRLNGLAEYLTTK